MRLDLRELAAVFVGGFVGAVVRAQMAESLATAPGDWPWETFAVNAVGTFLLGYLVTWLNQHRQRSVIRHPLIGAGFCGALTTFSTMQVELLWMFDAGRTSLAFVYAGASVVVGFTTVVVANNLARIGSRPHA